MPDRNTSLPYLVEWLQIGRHMKVSAIDPESGIEVSIIGDARVSVDVLKRHAVRKLEAMIVKSQN